MYKSKMVKVFLRTLPFYILGFIINLFVLEIYPCHVVAQDLKPDPNTEQVANPKSDALEPEILSEINRVRTDPHGYSQWLESQRQYYDGIWLKLPGEKPIRTNRGLKALEEAIAVLKNQQPLSALNISKKTAITATNKLENFATANNIQNISYGRVTPKGIVMSIVVDEIFPDRRRRKSLLSSNAEDTGVVCKPDPRYAKVCAIAYSDTVADTEIATAQPESNPKPNSESNSKPNSQSTNQTVASQPGTARAKPETPITPKEEPTPKPPENAATVAPSETSNSSEEDNTEDNAIVPSISIPQPPQPPQPQAAPSVTEANPAAPEAKNDVVIETAQADAEIEGGEEEKTGNNQEIEPDPEVEEKVNEEEKNKEEDPELVPEEKLNEEADIEEPTNAEEDNTEVFEAEPENSEKVDPADPNSTNSANNSDSLSILEDIEEKGTLEDGDLTIPEDGSFYDSYPIEGKSGDSITIYLESDKFDPFVALIDDKGNIIEQNDDISEEDSNSEIEVTIPQDGSYNVIVNAYDEGGKGEYVLTLKHQ